jgi:hypothetical protein
MAAREYTRGVTDLILDSSRSRVRVHTFAEGVFARLAHDLELACDGLVGSGSREGAGRGSATIDAPLSAFRVVGTFKDGRVDDKALSPSDRRDILEKMRREVFHAGEGEALRVEVAYDGGAAEIRLRLPAGRAFTETMRPSLREDGHELFVSGALEVSLAALGSDVIKGPMGAFRVKDRVEVLVELVFRPGSIQPA